MGLLSTHLLGDFCDAVGFETLSSSCPRFIGIWRLESWSHWIHILQAESQWDRIQEFKTAVGTDRVQGDTPSPNSSCRMSSLSSSWIAFLATGFLFRFLVLFWFFVARVVCLQWATWALGQGQWGWLDEGRRYGSLGCTSVREHRVEVNGVRFDEQGWNVVQSYLTKG